MDDQARAVLKQKIVDTIAKTREEIKYLEEVTRPIAPENAIGRVSRMDAINNKSVSEATLRTSQRKLASLKAALSRIDQPGFGVCAHCRRPIAPARLMFMPQSDRCVRCAER